MLAAHDAILATDFDTYVGGHVYRTGTRADVRQLHAHTVLATAWPSVSLPSSGQAGRRADRGR